MFFFLIRVKFQTDQSVKFQNTNETNVISSIGVCVCVNGDEALPEISARMQRKSD